MTPKETVIALYAAYASRDPAQIAEFLHKDVTWIAPQAMQRKSPSDWATQKKRDRLQAGTI